MENLSRLGRLLIFIGMFIAAIGVLFTFVQKIPGLGRLPGDIHIEGKNFSLYFPVATCLLLSLIISLLIWLLTKFN